MTKLERYYATSLAARKALETVWNAIRANLNLEKPILRIGDRKIAAVYEQDEVSESGPVIYVAISDLTVTEACALRDWLNDLLAEI